LSCSKRDLSLVLIWTCLLGLPFLGKAFHIDEPLYLPVARHILSDPLHPYAFLFNWYGRGVPYAQINNTPPLLHYLLALDWKITGGGEWPMRLAFFPLDLIAAAALYLLAARFLSRPLLPVLIVIASPAYLINMEHLMAEKIVAAFAFSGLYALVRGVDEDDPSWYWGSAALLAGAAASKHSAGLFLAPALGYALQRGARPGRLLGYTALALSPLAAYLTWDRLGDRAVLGAAWQVTAQAFALPTARWSHKLRSILAFAGGCGVVTAAWPYFVRPVKGWRLALLLTAVVLLFSPVLDLAPVVRSADRALGATLACGAAWGFWQLFAGPRRRGWSLWAPWILGALLLVSLYWSVMARQVLFMIPPLVFASAEALEARLSEGRLRALYLVSLVCVAALSLTLARVDYRYAAMQKVMAGFAAAERPSPGRRVWCAGHWGLQYYMEREGASELDLAQGGWDAARPGDVVVVPSLNSNVLRPRRPVLADTRLVTLSYPVPLRLISGRVGEGGFYSNVSGFLPYSICSAPLDEFELVTILPPEKRTRP
jgi:4-amino-4-deoxy-L-arabinose transferase-like glycosyltransferase